MPEKIYVLYQKTNPFPGWIRAVSYVNPDQPPDGSTLAERFSELKIKWSDSELSIRQKTPKLPNPEAVKYDEVTGNLIPLSVGDITPTAALKIEATEAKVQMTLDGFQDMTFPEIDHYVKTTSHADGNTKKIIIRLANCIKAIQFKIDSLS